MSIMANTWMRAISMLGKIGCVILVLVVGTVGISFTLQNQNTTNGSDSLTKSNATAPGNTTTVKIPTETNDTGETGNPPVKNNATQPDKQNYVSKTGTIKFLCFEGGFYGIVSDDGKHYDPGSLDQEFQVDGLRVEFEAETIHSMATIHMWGTPVSIIHMEKLNS